MTTDETQPVQGTPHPDPEQPADEQESPAPTEEPVVEKRRRIAGLRDRARAVRGGMVAAVLAGVIVGGAGGFAVGALATGHDHHGPGLVGRPFDHDGDGDDRGFRPDGLPGQLPPTTAPEESDLSNS